MKILLLATLLSSFFMLSGCGGKDDKKSENVPVNVEPPLIVNNQYEISFDEKGCLITSNAEATTNVSVAGKELQLLTWNCSVGEEFFSFSPKKIDVYLEYDANQACYKKVDDEFVDIVYGLSNAQCGVLAAPLSLPIYRVDIVEFNVEAKIDSNDTASFSFSFKIQNTGNMPVYFWNYKYIIKPLAEDGFFEVRGAHLNQGFGIQPAHEFSSADLGYENSVGGFDRNKSYKVTFSVFDYYGTELSSRELDVSP